MSRKATQRRSGKVRLRERHAGQRELRAQSRSGECTMLWGSKPHNWEGLGYASGGASAKRLAGRAAHRGPRALSMGWGCHRRDEGGKSSYTGDLRADLAQGPQQSGSPPCVSDNPCLFTKPQGFCTGCPAQSALTPQIPTARPILWAWPSLTTLYNTAPFVTGHPCTLLHSVWHFSQPCMKLYNVSVLLHYHEVRDFSASVH